jgi:periplasmic protein CpxP/Spy
MVNGKCPAADARKVKFRKKRFRFQVAVLTCAMSGTETSERKLMLKHSLIALMVAALLCMAAPGVLGQETGGQQPTSAAPAEPEHAHAQMDPSKHAAMLAKHLKLNSDQQSKVEDILKSQKSQMQSLRSDTSLSKQDRHSKMMDIHKSSNDQIRGVLDPDQQKKWDEMQSKHEERMAQHHHGQASGAAPTSPQ